MKISVITPSFNCGRFIEATIRSVLAQRANGDAKVEYIVVDGASSDGTPAILERYRREIDVVVSEPDRGPADAINKGLRLATTSPG